MTLREVGRHAALSLLATAVALLGLECSVRLWQAVPSQPPRSDRPVFFYAPDRGPSLNDDYAYPPRKPPDTFRIVVVGDSFTFPYDVQFDDVFSKRLERMLNLSVAPGERNKAEVLNFGRPGIGMWDEVPVVIQGLEWNPDLVLLQITLNDGRFVSPYPLEYLLPPHLRHPAIKRWRTLELVLNRIYAVQMRRAFVVLHRSGFDDPASWREFADSITAMRDACAAKKVPFAAVTFPMFEFPQDGRYPLGDIHAKIASLLVTLGVPSLDLLPAFTGMWPERLHTRPVENAHPNEIAHRLAAEQIYLWLEREKLIPEALVVRRKFSIRGLISRPFTPPDAATR